MTDKKINEIYEKCIVYTTQIKNPILRDCSEKILRDYKDALCKKPATPGSHHFYKGGLLYHTYCVTRNAVAIASFYPDLKVDVDLIIFGGLLHDIGKSNDFADFNSDANYQPHCSNSFDLLGHSYEGTHIVENYLKEYQLDEEFKNQIIHMIGSHMNEYSEWGALVLPKMLEVIILNYGDAIDAYLEPAHEIIQNAIPGELYKIGNAPRPYYKSLNPYYEG